MNYRHAYHAGNFADVIKHVLLSRVLTYMTLKPQPFRVIDTHAGAGIYDLTGLEANKTGEWRDGIGRLIDADMPSPIAELLAPYLNAVAAVNGDTTLERVGPLSFYPGSPLIARQLMRPGDRLVANELHPEDWRALKTVLKRDDNTTVLQLDAWVAIKAQLPPPERRGLILIDPPFEQPDEFERLAQALGDGLRRFSNGVYLIWYPVKNRDAAEHFVGTVAMSGWPKMLDVRLKISEPFAGLGLTETGVLALNAPYTLRAELECLLPFLVTHLGEGQGAAYTISEPAAPLA